MRTLSTQHPAFHAAVNASAEAFGVPAEHIHARNREQRVADARCTAMHLLYAHTGLSMAEVARHFRLTPWAVQQAVKKASHLPDAQFRARAEKARDSFLILYRPTP